jgi:hypothetical protein
MPLSKYFKPKFSYDLVRIGKNNDGGYLIDFNSFKKSESLVSLGINDDWSFEKDFFLKRNKKIIVECYDDKLNERFLIKNLVIQFIFIFFHKKLQFFIEAIIKLLSYKKLKKIFLFKKKKISYRDLDKILKKKKNTFLKIDIEAGEYRILNDILFNQHKIVGLVIEFHDVDLHKETIINFIKSLKLTLVHIHGNNYSSIDFNGDPIVIELSFGRSPIRNHQPILFPNKLDMPNNKSKDEVVLKFIS